MSNPNQKEQQNLDLVKILDEYINKDNKFPYDYLLSFIRQKQNDAPFLISILQKLTKCVHLLDPRFFESTLINLIFFEIKWNILHSRNEQLFAGLLEFLLELNSAYTSYACKCLNMLLRNFLVFNPGEEQLIDCEVVYKFSHQIIANLVKIVPSSKVHLVKQIETLYPYMIKDTLMQEAYIRNVLKVSEYVTELRLTLLEICIQKMLKVDVSCTREQIAEAELNTQEPSTQSMHFPLADRLDVMMEHMLSYIRTNCYKQSPNESDCDNQLDWESCKSLYKDLLFTFDKYVVCTYGSSHVQFLMFYICSCKGLLSEGFLDYLWKKFSSPASCQITKQIATYYIGSLLARAKYVNLQTCAATLQLIVKWIHGYIEKHSNAKSFANFDLHRTFYALCQTLFYVIIFRHRQLFFQEAGQADMLSLVKSWKLNEIVSSKLNPLRYCLPAVTKKFSRVAYINQVAYCYSIIDANNRVSLPTTSEASNNKRMFFASNKSELGDGAKSNVNKPRSSFRENPLDSFFPFDPYLLKRSKPFIDKFYQEFQNVVDDEEMELDSDEDEDGDDDDNEEEEEDDSDDDKIKTDDDDDDEEKKIQDFFEVSDIEDST